MVGTADVDAAAGDSYAGFDDALSFREAKERAVGTWERWYVQELLSRHAGNITRAARAARMDTCAPTRARAAPRLGSSEG